ncbi:unnamed protein product [Pseudo-nitzschia multistriata]|uniref:Uncharacterized protein n=1 Tax=Pseudo-nitzschia multistriata TaxID=183589 RepID=A0A448Z2Q6_9STRA|nr:unnamed protein product [Pseudo-nitzschia multistriata]
MVRGDENRRSQTKRRFRQFENSHNDQGLETVDDLVHAAQFAIIPNTDAATFTPLVESVNPAKKQEDGNEIDVNDDDSNSDVSIADAEGADNSNENDCSSDSDSCSSDDESDDEDITQAVQRMEQATAAEEEAGLTASNPPKTDNEVDGYKVPIKELESQLQIRLTVDEATVKAATNDGSNNSTSNQLSLAGRIKNYMSSDRTVVVESAAIPAHSAGFQQTVGPLDEGSLLVVKKTENEGDRIPAERTSLIPLGRIFEVFGPVSQPLYTIRLPSPPSTSKNKKSSNPRSQECNSEKKASKKENELTEFVKQGDNKAVDKNEDDMETIGDNEQGNIPNNAPTIPETSEKANDAVVTNLSSSSCTEDYISGKEKSDTSMNKDSPPNILPDEKTESARVNEASTTTVEPTSPDNIDRSPENTAVDMWAVNGEYAKFLAENKNIEVYYIEDEAKLIDTSFVMKTSGKGCDASNIYDEEIINSSEAYYSDDEKEREAKNKKKGAGRKKNQQRNNDRRQQREQRRNNNSTRYPNRAHTGYHGQPPPPLQGFNYVQGHANLPQGFHQMGQQQYPHGGIYQAHPTYQYPPGSTFHRQVSGAPPPPPPPPPSHNQTFPYRGTPQHSQAPNAVSRMAPPPPPPKNPNEPPAYQY